MTVFMYSIEHVTRVVKRDPAQHRVWFWSEAPDMSSLVGRIHWDSRFIRRATSRYASNFMPSISLSGGRRSQRGLRKTQGFNPYEGVRQC